MNTQPTVAAVEVPRDSDPPFVHCPLCGRAAFERDPDTGVWDENPCEHLAFAYAGSAGHFGHQSEDFRRRIAEREASRTGDDVDDGLDVSEPGRFLAELGYAEHLLVISITYSFTACGPVWSTDIYGYDLMTLCEEED